MFFRSKLYRVLFTLAIVMSLSAFAFADTIRLKDGSIIKGKIVSFSDGKFVVAIGEGSRRRELGFTAVEIDSIEFDSPQAPLRTASAENRRTVETPQPQPISAPVEDEIVKVDTEEESKPPVVPAAAPKTVQKQAPASNVKPVALSVRVLADNTANGWTNSGWVVKKGQRIHIKGDGQVSLGKGKVSTPSGVAEIDDADKLVKHAATGALIAVIGDDNNEFIYVGAEREFTAARDGALFLGVNEGNLDDNSGAFDVKIEILPGTGSE